MAQPQPSYPIISTLNFPIMRKELNILPGGVVDELDVVTTTQLPQRTLRRLRQAGKLRFTKVGKRIFYPAIDIERLMNGTLDDSA